MTRMRNLLFAGVLFMAPNAIAGDIDVMTQNQYLGADLTPVIEAAMSGDLTALNNAVIEALEQAAANQTNERMDAQAALIAGRRPHFVGLQEVYTFLCDDPFGTGACQDQRVAAAVNKDFLELTQAALDGAYTSSAAVLNLSATVPFDLYGFGMPAFLTVIDRDVILTRSDVAATPVDFACANTSLDGCNYIAALPPIPTPLGDIAVVRGYVGVDATVDGIGYRVVNTHLEVKDPPIPALIQSAQAQELIEVLAVTTPIDKSLIVLGDINSSPDEPLPSPYAQFAEIGGYTDAWTLRPGNVAGFGCCQSEDLSNRKSALDERIDMVLAREIPLQVKQARVLGDKVSSKTHPPGQGLWPSDHGAVATELQF